MAFEVKSGGGGKNLIVGTQMHVGQSVTGYLIGFRPNKFNEQKSDVVLQSETGQEILITAAGNLGYMEKDAGNGQYSLKTLTRITRQPDRQTKSGRTRSHFLIEQDDTKTLSQPSNQDDLLKKVEEAKARAASK